MGDMAHEMKKLKVLQPSLLFVVYCILIFIARNIAPLLEKQSFESGRLQGFETMVFV
jgi:hypothetical protein